MTPSSKSSAASTEELPIANAPIEYPTFEDGIRQLRVLDAVLESSQKRAWVQV